MKRDPPRQGLRRLPQEIGRGASQCEEPRRTAGTVGQHPEHFEEGRATLQLVQEFCAGKVAEVRCAVLYEKPRSAVKCEYVWRRTDRWITFPWSAEEPVLQALSEPV